MKRLLLAALTVFIIAYSQLPLAAPPTPQPQGRPVVQTHSPVKSAPTVKTTQPIIKPTSSQPVKTQVVSPCKGVKPPTRSIASPGAPGSTNPAYVTKARTLSGAKGVAASVNTDKQSISVATSLKVAVDSSLVAKKVTDNVQAKTTQSQDTASATKSDSQKTKTGGATQLTDKEVGAIGKGVGGALEKAGFNLVNPSSNLSGISADDKASIGKMLKEMATALNSEAASMIQKGNATLKEMAPSNLSEANKEIASIEKSLKSPQYFNETTKAEALKNRWFGNN